MISKKEQVLWISSDGTECVSFTDANQIDLANDWFKITSNLNLDISWNDIKKLAIWGDEIQGALREFNVRQTAHEKGELA